MTTKKQRKEEAVIPSSFSGSILQDCLQWMQDRGAMQLENVSFQASPGTCGNSLGLFATKAFKRDEILFKIPQSCIINIGHALASPLSKEILHAFTQLDEHDDYNELMTAELLLWVFMSEQRQDATKHFYPYLHTLHAEAPTPHFWSPTLLQCLTGTNLEILNGSERILKEQSSLLLKLIPVFNGSFDKNRLSVVFSYSSLSWARGHYLSRGWDNIFELAFEGDELVDVNDLSAMVPILDICNHRPGEDWIKLQAEGDMLLVITNCDLLPGDEIYGNYGDKSNEILLYAYGFSLQNNPFDSVAVKIGAAQLASADPSQPDPSLPYYILRGEGIQGIPVELWKALSSLGGDEVEEEEEDGEEEVEVGLEECQLLIQFLEKKMKVLESSEGLAEATRRAIGAGYSTDSLRLQ